MAGQNHKAVEKRTVWAVPQSLPPGYFDKLERDTVVADIERCDTILAELRGALSIIHEHNNVDEELSLQTSVTLIRRAMDDVQRLRESLERHS